MWGKRKKKQKRPAFIIRLAWRCGWKPGRFMREVLEWAEVIVVAGGLAVLIMTFITVRMHVPTDSMWPTINGDRNLLKADSFFVDRITYYFRDPKPGDIVVFRHPRLIRVRSIDEGSRADQVGMEAGEVLMTSQPVGYPVYMGSRPIYTDTALNENLAALPNGEQIVLTTAEGNRYMLGTKSDDIASIEDLGLQLTVKNQMYVKRLIAVGGQTVQIEGGDIFVDGARLEGERFDQDYYSNDRRFQYGIEPTLVPEGHYFMLGDNSADSFDSRFWGFVPDNDIVGVPYLRVWPFTRFGVM